MHVKWAPNQSAPNGAFTLPRGKGKLSPQYPPLEITTDPQPWVTGTAGLTLGVQSPHLRSTQIWQT